MLLAPIFLAAQPDPSPVDDAPVIVVTGESLPAGAGDVAFDVTSISRERLADTASGRLEDALADIGGFAEYRRSDARSAHPTSQGATLRGLGGNASSRALVLLDGVPLTDPFGGWINFAAVDPARLSAVRVTRGGGTGVYGPGALAGTIELFSGGPDTLPGLWADAFGGSRASVDLDGGASARVGGGFATVSGSWQRGDGFTPIAAADRGAVDRPAPYDQANVSLRVLAPIDASTELQVSGLAFTDRRERGTDFTTNRNDGFDMSARLVGRGRWGFEASGYVQVRQFASQFASVAADRATVTQSLDQYDVPATGLGGRIELRPPTPSGTELRLGADARAVSGETRELYTFVAGQPTRSREAGGDALTAGLFADASWKPGERWTLTGGARVDRWRLTDGFIHERTIATGAAITDADDPDRSGWRPTARAGVAFEPGHALKFRSAAYLGWRLPTLNELYRPYRVGPDATAANAALSPERLRGVDGGVDYSPLPNLRVSATLFANRLEDAIANVTLSTGPGTFPGVGFVAAGGAYRVRQNIDAITSRGAELDASLSWNLWRLTGSAALTDARVHASGDAAQLDGLRPAETPRTQASLTLAYEEPGSLRGSVTLRATGAQWDDDLETARLKPAFTADATLGYPVLPRLVAEVRVENLANALVEAARPQPDVVERASPRTIWLGLRFQR